MDEPGLYGDHNSVIDCDGDNEDNSHTSDDGGWPHTRSPSGECHHSNRHSRAYMFGRLSHPPNHGPGRRPVDRLLRGAMVVHIITKESVFPLILIGVWVWGGIYFRVPSLPSLLPLRRDLGSGVEPGRAEVPVGSRAAASRT